MDIPKLKTTKIDYAKNFVSNYTDMENFFEEICGKFPGAILDVFDTTLDTKETRMSLLRDEYFRLSQEYKYLNFIEEVFSINDNMCFIKLDFRRYEASCASRMFSVINRLDAIDKLIFINQELNLCNCADINFIIEDINLLKMFLKSMLREIMRVDLYFDKKPLLLFGNFDLSLPIAFKNSDDMAMYEKIANNHGLYFR
ncbi:MAG: hypothetical protein LBG67_03980 [Campylobacteraceae bacterium]|jgi:hypothetical protein|nr:hypothetical protein [Campylobacteraceae bacterium]